MVIVFILLGCGFVYMQIEYSSFNRDFYEEHSDIASLSNQEVVELKKKLGLKVR